MAEERGRRHHACLPCLRQTACFPPQLVTLHHCDGYGRAPNGRERAKGGEWWSWLLLIPNMREKSDDGVSRSRFMVLEDVEMTQGWYPPPPPWRVKGVTRTAELCLNVKVLIVFWYAATGSFKRDVRLQGILILKWGKVNVEPEFVSAKSTDFSVIHLPSFQHHLQILWSLPNNVLFLLSIKILERSKHLLLIFWWYIHPDYSHYFLFKPLHHFS